MRKRVAAVIGTAALIGAALPAVVAAPASAASFSCHPVGHAYIVNKEKVAVHASPSRNARVTGYVYKDNKVNAKLECENSGGTWECIGDCHDPEESLAGRWVHRGDLRADVPGRCDPPRRGGSQRPVVGHPVGVPWSRTVPRTLRTVALETSSFTPLAPKKLNDT